MNKCPITRTHEHFDLLAGSLLVPAAEAEARPAAVVRRAGGALPPPIAASAGAGAASVRAAEAAAIEVRATAGGESAAGPRLQTNLFSAAGFAAGAAFSASPKSARRQRPAAMCVILL